jgi:VWFA-related protein
MPETFAKLKQSPSKETGMKFDRFFNPGSALALPVLAAVLCLNFSARAQDQSPAVQKRPDEAPPSAAGSHRMTIHVTVTDKLGHHVSGLNAADFTLLDNKEPQKLLDFRAVDEKGAGDPPGRIVIVLDTINIGFNDIAWQRQQLAEFLKQDSANLGYPTSLAVFADGGVKLAQGWTRDGNALLAALDKTQSELRIIGRSAGFYGDAEKLQLSLGQLSQLSAYEADQPGRKLLLVIGQGWPMLPGAGSMEDMKQREWVFNAIVQLTNGLRESGITLYCLDPFQLGRRSNPFYYQGYLKGIPSAKNAEYPDLALQVLAEHSGGEVEINGRDVVGDLNLAVRDAVGGYDLTFDAAQGDRPNEYHAIQVQVNSPNVKVRTVSGYYARPEVEGGKKAK